MRRTALSVLAGVLLLGAAVAPVTAHPAPDELPYETRLLHDHDDDRQGAVIAEDGHDLIALDVHETFDSELEGHVLHFKLTMAGGFSSLPTAEVLRDEIRFTADGETEHTLAFETEDNEAFTGDFDRIEGPEPVLTEDGEQDEDRFTVTGVVLAESIGLAEGSVLTEITAHAFADDREMDTMPGDDGTGGEDTVVQVEEYALVGTDAFLNVTSDPDEIVLEAEQEGEQDAEQDANASAEGETEADGEADDDEEADDGDEADGGDARAALSPVTLTLENTAGVEQAYEVTFETSQGLLFTLDEEDDSGDLVLEGTLGADESVDLALAVGPENASALGVHTLTVTVTTDLGGRNTLDLSVTVEDTDDDDDASDEGDAGDGSGGVGVGANASAEASLESDTELEAASTDDGGALGVPTPAVGLVIAAAMVTGLVARIRRGTD